MGFDTVCDRPCPSEFTGYFRTSPMFTHFQVRSWFDSRIDRMKRLSVMTLFKAVI